MQKTLGKLDSVSALRIQLDLAAQEVERRCEAPVDVLPMLKNEGFKLRLLPFGIASHEPTGG